jgi:nucleoside-diphosphate-sugar epimerase
VGHALVDRLLRENQGSLRATYYSQAAPEASPEAEWVQTDLRDRDACRAALRGCDAALMVAAVTGGSASSKNEPWNQVTDNLAMGSQFLHACYLEKVPRVVLVGSATCYPPNDEALQEDSLDWNVDPFEAHFGIGWVTRSMEKLARFWHDKTGMEIILVRAANIFGPYAKFDPATSNFLPALMRKAVEKLDPFVVWGSPDVVRDVIYSVDFADDLVQLLNHKEVAFDVFNVGSGKGITVQQAVNWCLEYSGHHPREVTYTASAAPATRARILDCLKLEQLLGSRTPLGIERGIRDTLTWYQLHHTIWNR